MQIWRRFQWPTIWSVICHQVFIRRKMFFIWKFECLCVNWPLLCILFTELFESTLSLQRLNISHNTLSEFNADILSRCKHIVELDLSHNQITILKVNEVWTVNAIITRFHFYSECTFLIDFFFYSQDIGCITQYWNVKCSEQFTVCS